MGGILILGRRLDSVTLVLPGLTYNSSCVKVMGQMLHVWPV